MGTWLNSRDEARERLGARRPSQAPYLKLPEEGVLSESSERLRWADSFGL